MGESVKIGHWSASEARIAVRRAGLLFAKVQTCYDIFGRRMNSSLQGDDGADHNANVCHLARGGMVG